MKTIISVLPLVAAVVFSATSFADSPPDQQTPDAHSVPAKGTLSLYRVQTEGLGFGKKGDNIDAEVFVALDTKPNTIFSVKISESSPAINKVMADTLRDAYLNNVPVTLYSQIAPGKSNVKIQMVQLEKKTD